MAEQNNQDSVTLVALETFTPYRKDEVFTVTKAEADALLTPNLRENDFGPIYPNVKVRLFDPEGDAHLLLRNKALNQKEHAALEAKMRAAVK